MSASASVLLAISLSTSAHAQAGFLNKAKQAAEAARAKAAAGATPAAPAGGPDRPRSFTGSDDGPQAADVSRSPHQIVLTKVRPASFADAKSKAVTELQDGEALWVVVKTAGPLSQVAGVRRYAGQPELYELVLSVTPEGDDRSNANCVWGLSPQEAARDELILGLSPKQTRKMRVEGGSLGQQYTAACWLETVAGSKSEPGVWRNRIVLKNNVTDHRDIGKVLAAAPVTASVPNGFPKWHAARQKSCSIAEDSAPTRAC